jgi:hypothetical protein
MRTDSDVIRREIDATARRIHDTVDILEDRGRHAAHAALKWTAWATALALLAIAALVMKGHGRRLTPRGTAARLAPVPDERTTAPGLTRLGT